jgi:PAS domain S-box-containing protein
MSQGAGDAGDLQHLFADLPVMYVVTREEDGRPVIDRCNERFVETLGYEREALLGEPLSTVYAPGSASELESGGYQRALKDEFTTEERTLVRADGTVVHTLLRSVPRTDDVVGTTSLFIDVTAQEQRRRQATVLNRLLRHNLRNDMSVVLAHASNLLEQSEGAQRESARAIADIAYDWKRLIRKTQRISRVFTEDDNWSRTDLGPVLERVEQTLRETYPDATVRILRPQDGAATIRPEMELALRELCENAIRHASDQHPEVVVTVSVAEDEPWVKLTVTDDGPAIPKDELVPLREAEATPLIHGTGLGLWLVRLAVDQVGGDVTVVENDDDGTVVTLRYPAG